MKSTDVIGRSAHALLSLPNAVLAPLAGPRPTIDGQRLTPRLQLLAKRREARARRAVISADRAGAQVRRRGSMAHARARRRRELEGPERRRTPGTGVRADGTDDGPGGLRPRRWMAVRRHRRLPRRVCVPLENHWAE